MELLKKTLQDAFTFLFPLVLMDVTRETSTNTIKPSSVKAPVNQWMHAAKLCTAEDKLVVTPNVDTIYSQAWLDLSKGPILMTVPETDRFLNVEVLDAWTDAPYVVTEAGNYVFVREGYELELPDDIKRIDVDTDIVWLIVRILIKNQDDMVNVRAIQEELKLVPLDFFLSGKIYEAPEGSYNPESDFVPVQYVFGMTPEQFFKRANSLLAGNPIRRADIQTVKSFESLGIGAGIEFNNGNENLENTWKEILSEFVPRLNAECVGFSKKMGLWKMFDDPIANFGTEYAYRALVAVAGLGANPTTVAVYPKGETDSSGEPLDGNCTYTLHIDALPPVIGEGFWSITAYGADDFLIPNPVDRYSVNDRSEYTLNTDGSLDVTLSAAQPEDDSYWLPVCKGPFHLYLRIYQPDIEALNTWTAPEIIRGK